jgi:hypothetical protein
LEKFLQHGGLAAELQKSRIISFGFSVPHPQQFRVVAGLPGFIHILASCRH